MRCVRPAFTTWAKRPAMSREGGDERADRRVDVVDELRATAMRIAVGTVSFDDCEALT